MNYSTHNQKMRGIHNSYRKPNYALRKLSVGVASVLLSTTIFGLGIVHADTTSNDNILVNNNVEQEKIIPLQDSTNNQQSSNTTASHQQTTTADTSESATIAPKNITSSDQQTTGSQPTKATEPAKNDLNHQSTAQTEKDITIRTSASTGSNNGQSLTESKVTNRNNTSNMTISKETLASHFTWTVDAQGNVTITGLKDAADLQTGGILVLPNAQDFIDAGIIEVGHRAMITDKIINDIAINSKATEFNVSNNGNSTLKLAPDRTYNSVNHHCYSLFEGSQVVRSVLNNLDVAGSTDFSYLFNGATNLTSLDIANWDVSNGTNFNSMFNGAASLNSLDVANWNVANGTDFNNLFNGAASLTSLDVANWNVTNGTNFSAMFANAASLTKLNVANWNVTNGTNFNSMFNGAASLTSLDVTNWNVANGTDFSAMFDNTRSLTTLDITNWNVANGTNFSYMFGASGVTNLDVTNWNVANGTNFSAMFQGATKLTSLDVANWNVANGANFSAMFQGATKLTSLDVANWNVANGTNFSAMFQGATNLTNLNVANWDVTNGTDFSQLFSDANHLDKLDVANWCISKGTDFSGMFYNTAGLSYLDLRNWNIDTNVKADLMFGSNYDKLVVLTNNQSPFTNAEANKTGANVTPIDTAFNVEHVTTTIKPTRQDVYFMTEEQVQDFVKKVQAKIDAGNAFFKKYQDLATAVQTGDKNDSDLGNKIKAVKVLSDMADALDHGQADNGYQDVHLEGSDSTKPNDIIFGIYTLTATLNNQTVTVKYMDGDKEVKSDTISGKSGQKIPFTANIPTNYHATGDVPTTITVDPKGNQVVTIQLGHNTAPANNSKDVTRTIIVTNPDGTTTITKQTATLPRKGTKDLVTGKTTWGDWSTGTWDQFKAPEVKGYKEPSLPAMTVDGNTKDTTVKLIYQPTQATIDLHPFDKTPVKDPDHLTNDEKGQVQTNIKKSNSDKHIATIDVKDNGQTSITFEDGTQKELTPDETITQLPDAKPEAPTVTPEEQSTTPGKTEPTGETDQPGTTVIGTSTTKPVANQSSAQQKQQRLPQTGNQHEVAVAGLGLAVAMMSMFGLKKRKED